MKAAVLHAFGETPRFEDFPDPIPTAAELLIQVKAVALENVDKAMANGTHYATHQFLSVLPAIVGFDGIGTLEDGQLVGFGGTRSPYGAMAEKTVIPQGYYAPIPDGVDAAVAATVPGAALTSLLALRWIATLQAGETVLIHGATGFAGTLAVQIAKLLGAGRVVGTGRDNATLHALAALGADAVIDLKQSDDAIIGAFQQEARQGYDIVVDYLWGQPTNLLLQSLVPQDLKLASRRVRLVQLGEMAGTTISLPAAALRTSGLEIYGAGNFPHEAIPTGTAQVWDWVRDGKLHASIEEVALRDIAEAWNRTDIHGKRLVIVP